MSCWRAFPAEAARRSGACAGRRGRPGWPAGRSTSWPPASPTASARTGAVPDDRRLRFEATVVDLSPGARPSAGRPGVGLPRTCGPMLCARRAVHPERDRPQQRRPGTRADGTRHGRGVAGPVRRGRAAPGAGPCAGAANRVGRTSRSAAWPTWRWATGGRVQRGTATVHGGDRAGRDSLGWGANTIVGCRAGEDGRLTTRGRARFDEAERWLDRANQVVRPEDDARRAGLLMHLARGMGAYRPRPTRASTRASSARQSGSEALMVGAARAGRPGAPAPGADPAAAGRHGGALARRWRRC